MNNGNFDEYQLVTRQRIAYHSFFIVISLVLLNGVVASSYTWAPPLTQAFCIVLLPLLYFLTMAVFKNAYLGNKTKHPVFTGCFFLAIGAAYWLIWFSEPRVCVQEGALTDEIVLALIPILFLYLGAIILIKCWLDHRSFKRDSV